MIEITYGDKPQNKKKTVLVNFRLNSNQYERLKILASGEGNATVSQYIRFKLLNPSTEQKLNQIIELLQKLITENDKK